VERLHHDDIGGIGCVSNLLCLGRVRGERLLTQHVLAGGDRAVDALSRRDDGKRRDAGGPEHPDAQVGHDQTFVTSAATAAACARPA